MWLAPSITHHILTAAIDQYVLLRAFVDELARCGMREACTSPGSRSTPLILALVRDGRLRCHSHVDERAAGFFALGVAKASGRPAAVACTSGTAAAELLPAVAEALEARVPMIVLTADRPPELRELGAGQTIDQIKLYGTAAKWFFEVGTHDASERSRRWMRTLACRAWHTATTGRPGAVHLNFALREPLVIDRELPADDTARLDGRPFVEHADPPLRLDRASALLRRITAPGARGVVVAGRHERATPLGAAAAELCIAVGWPLLADPLSGARRGPAAIAHYDALLRDEEFAAAHRPDLVLRVGDLPPSKPLRAWLAAIGDQVAFDGEHARQDPDTVLGLVVAAEPASALSELAAAARSGSGAAQQGPSPWLADWRRADARAAAAIDGMLGEEGLSEPLVAATLGRLLPVQATLFVASSMPVRDVETFWPVREDAPRVLCNRGANGIDGTISSALGAAAGSHGPVVLLVGDVALAHDLGGLVGSRRLDPELGITVVLLNNQGGGIFDFLPVATAPVARADAGAALDIYTRHIATPTGLDFALAARLAGASHVHVQDLVGLQGALVDALEAPGTNVIEVRTERTANVALHRRVWSAVAGAARMS